MTEVSGLGGKFRISSAGTDSYHTGEAPDRRAIKIAASHGVDIARQRARRLAENDYHEFDYIYAMDGGHYYELQERAPKSGSKAAIRMFLESEDGRAEVPDPWYGTEKDFENVFVMVWKGAENILAAIRKEYKI